MCSQLQSNELTYRSCGRPPIKPLECLLLTLWTLANQESYRTIGDRFGVSRGNAHTIFLNTCKRICQLQKRYIQWPSGEKFRKTVNAFNELRGPNSFRNVVGCVDGSHIPIRGSTKDNSFYNRKGFHSMLLQAVCNNKLEFIDIFCGWPGSSHDARMWENSPIFSKLAHEELIPEGKVFFLVCTHILIRNQIAVS